MRKCLTLLVVLVLTTVLSFAQTKPVTGKVTDTQGASIPFSSIRIKGSKAGTNADAEGNFSIKVKSGDILLITGTGIVTKEVTVGSESVLNVQVTRNTTNLTEVVVTALGVARQSKELGYATASINNKTLIQAKSVNVQQALNGKVSGLNISTVNSGVFEAAKINIRGIRSLTGNNSPMLVVDGAPTELSFLSTIPPDDVQDLTVLKSAASAAIYGPDAVNGVIVITTKRGGKKPTVTFSSTVQATKVSFFPKLQRSFGQGAGETTDPYGNYDHIPYENQQFGPKFDGSMKAIGVPLEDGSIQMGPYNDSHFKDKIKFWNTGLTSQNSVSVAGEDFYLSVEDANIKGLVPDDVNRRTSLRFNGGKKYSNFSVNYGLNYVLNNFNVVNENGFKNTFAGAYNGGLFFLIEQVANNVPLLQYKDLNSKYGQFGNYYNEFSVNPYWLIQNIRRKGRSDNLVGNVDLNLQVLPWLKATTRLSTNLNFNSSKYTNSALTLSDWALKRNSTQYSNKLGIVSDDDGFTSRINLDYFLSGDRRVDDLTFKYLVGGTLRQDRAKDVQVGGNNLLVPGLYNVQVRSGDANVGNFGSTPSSNFDITQRLYSVYGTVGFNYKGWANLELTGRNDWDSRLLKQNRSFFYPAANASLVLSDIIGGLQASEFISMVKLRGAISKSGNVNLNPYSLQATYSQPPGFPFGNVGGFTSNGTIPSLNLKPEFVSTTEFGTEWRFLKNRISFEATYFFQRNTNQILQVTQSATTGYTTNLANAADFNNYGVEMDLNLTPLVRVGKGRFDVKINATYNNNKVTNTLGNVPVIAGGNVATSTAPGFIQNAAGGPTVNNIAVKGGPAFQFQLSDYLRDPASGKVVVDPVTGNPTAAPGLVTMGRTLPLWIVGITPSFTLGDFYVAMTWDFKGGHNYYSGLGPDADFAGISARSAEYDRKRFVFPNSVYMQGGKYVPNTNIQVQDGNYNFWTGANTNNGIATNYYSSANAWRLRELNVSYSLPNKWLGGNKIFKKVTVSLVGKNLLLILPKSNQWGDPEFNYSTTGNTFGIASGFQSPASRLFGASLTVQF